MRIQRISGPLQSVRYWDNEAYRLISWNEDENTALYIAERLTKKNKVKVVLNESLYGIYFRER